MERQRLILILIIAFLVNFACNKTKENNTSRKGSNTEQPEQTVHDKVLVDSLTLLKLSMAEEGYEFFDYVDEKTKETIIMQKYFIAFLKRGPERSQNKAATDSLQALHMAHLGRMYEEGYADISGPFGDDGDIRGITIYNVPTLQMADSLANLDPSVQAGRLEIEVHPWWAAKGFPLR